MGLSKRVAAALGFAYARWDDAACLPVSPARTSRCRYECRSSPAIWSLGAGDEHRGRPAVLERRRGRAYDPEVVDAALQIGLESLRDCRDDVWEVVLTLEPPLPMSVSGPGLLRALGALGDYADLKLPERSGYARRVTRIVSAAAEIADLEPRTP